MQEGHSVDPLCPIERVEHACLLWREACRLRRHSSHDIQHVYAAPGNGRKVGRIRAALILLVVDLRGLADAADGGEIRLAETEPDSLTLDPLSNG